MIVSHGEDRRLGHGFGNDGIHLAGHDAAAGLPRWQPELTQPSLWAAGEQAQVPADLDEVGGQGFEQSRDLYEYIGILGGFHQVFGSREAKTRDLPQLVHYAEDVVPGRSETCADRGTP
jgi:hypothetical protein